MTLIQKLLPVALLAAVGASQAAGIPMYTEIGTSSGDMKFTTPSTGIYQNLSVKINKRYTFTPELSTTIKHTETVEKKVNGVVVLDEKGEAVTEEVLDFNVVHNYLRFVVSDNSLAKMGDWTMAIAYRYVAPTTKAAQAAGTLGRFDVRPAFTTKSGPFSLLIRDAFQLHLQRGNYQVNPVGAKNPGANALIGHLFEVVPEYDLGNNFGASLYLGASNTFMGAAKGDTRTRWANHLDLEAEIGYTVSKLGNTNFALAIGTGTDYGKTAKFESAENTLFSSGDSYLSLKISKAY